jgi:hypothetical protein
LSNFSSLSVFTLRNEIRKFSNCLYFIGQKLGWTYQVGEPDQTALLRTLTIPLLANAGDSATRTEALSRFDKFELMNNQLFY